MGWGGGSVGGGNGGSSIVVVAEFKSNYYFIVSGWVVNKLESLVGVTEKTKFSPFCAITPVLVYRITLTFTTENERVGVLKVFISGKQKFNTKSWNWKELFEWAHSD